MKKIGFTLIVLSLVVLLACLLEPLKEAWDSFWAMGALPKLAIGLGVIGFLFLLVSLITERWQERGQDQSLRDE
ncbi:MAG: hypothetical protein QF412_08635 [Planctomycetota bacterium]|jgi:isoprenylcysteine carboxyl methyltransferase (ICMT) family protein YpbQ|nr:hypothetical protein [Planctomycetota bacterium]